MKQEKWIEQSMTAEPRTVSRKQTVGEAWAALEKGKFRHLPVVERGKVVGIVSERDLRQAVALADRVELTVKEVMTPDPYTVPVGTALVEVVREMARHKYGSAVVTGAKGEVVGIFTRSDAMRLLAELLDKNPQAALRRLSIEDYLSPGYLI